MTKLRELVKELDVELKKEPNKYWASFHVMSCVIRNVPEDGVVGRFLKEIAYMLETSRDKEQNVDIEWVLKRLHLQEGYDHLTAKLERASKELEAAQEKMRQIVEATKE